MTLQDWLNIPESIASLRKEVRAMFLLLKKGAEDMARYDREIADLVASVARLDNVPASVDMLVEKLSAMIGESPAEREALVALKAAIDKNADAISAAVVRGTPVETPPPVEPPPVL